MVSQVVRRAVDASPQLQRVVKSALAQHVIQTQRAAQVVDRPVAFIAGQAAGGTRTYTTRRGGATVTIRHRSRDVNILNEVFGSTGAYRAPAALAGFLSGPLRIMDVGANVGMFGSYALAHWNVVSMRSYEPDPGNAVLLSAQAARDERWSVEEVAVSNEPGTLRFRVGLFSESRAARGDEPAIEVPLVDLFTLQPCDVLKIDIEGGEWPILTDARLSDLEARAIVMEWHQPGCPYPDSQAAAKRLLAEAGFTGQDVRPELDGQIGTLWAWRER